MRKAALGLTIAGLALATNVAAAAEFPSAPIRMVVPFAAGSGTDQQARAFGQALTERYGVTVVVENKPGAGGSLAAQDVARAAPDGYTVLMTTNTTHAANEHLYKNLPYDPVKDFTPVTALSKGAMLMVVNAGSPVKSVGEFIALAKEKPGGLTFGSGSSSSRVGGEMFQQLTGVKMLHVPYKSNPQAHIDLIGGQIDVVFSDVSSTIAHVQSGKLRALGYTGAKRTPILPDLPTVAEAGVPGYEVSYWTAMYLPPGAPQPVVDKLHEMFVTANEAAPMQRIRAASSSEVFTTTPQGLAEFQAEESRKWGEVIRAAGIEPE
ncbi:tripartite tricarboxylate transporter substrate binding protein [Verticiella sediminum]|uniref:Tripartite tricarboxylate transporter substrate binding protein n=2 Tax=Verticiella sediminum TaxID=1247510 RepID=A0A556AD08_9BURK|nr:tripartite tricarboxylate transporter substrate binding protein [Verticiella sediminum]